MVVVDKCAWHSMLQGGIIFKCPAHLEVLHAGQPLEYCRVRLSAPTSRRRHALKPDKYTACRSCGRALSSGEALRARLRLLHHGRHRSASFAHCSRCEHLQCLMVWSSATPALPCSGVATCCMVCVPCTASSHGCPASSSRRSKAFVQTATANKLGTKAANSSCAC